MMEDLQDLRTFCRYHLSGVVRCLSVPPAVCLSTGVCVARGGGVFCWLRLFRTVEPQFVKLLVL